ncbi:uncharacterized protein LOC141651568 [Silene latifolia]|uniref:uncharacterized protein LOC141651568 n=1 Tax=Silene latifolia TaxID=37657 RepID=UPI003D772172
MNAMKSNIYFNGVSSSVKADILLVSGFLEGHTPFKYLGVPIVSGRLSMKNCVVLIDNVTARIKIFGARKLSYSGRLILVNYVLTTLHSHWATIFVILRGVLRRIDSICRNYLWDGSTEYLRSPLVIWEKVCTPKCEGGLGIRNSFYWNAAAIGKLAWWVYSKPDSLRVKWVSHIYLKGHDWSTYSPKPDVSWSWKTICKIKDTFLMGYSAGHWTYNLAGYTISSGYHWIRQPQPLVTLYNAIWNTWCVPKHTFINWLIAKEVLQLKSKLFLLGISHDDKCLICDSAAETHSHLFQYCTYTMKILGMISAFLNIRLPTQNTLMWVQAKPWARLKKKVTNAWIQALYYYMWRQRNQVRIEGMLTHSDRVFHEIRCIMKTRSFFWNQYAKTSREKAWLTSISS